MSKSVVIHLGLGDLYSGLPRVTAQLWSGELSRPEQMIGSLPAAPELAELYRNWRSLYYSLCDRQSLRSTAEIGLKLEDDLEIDHSGVTNVSQVSFEQLSQTLQNALNTWLGVKEFLPIERQLRSRFSLTDEIRVVIETDNDLLRRLPWYGWDFFKDYPKAEMALSCSAYQSSSFAPPFPRKKARILAVLGNSQGINLQREVEFLNTLKDAETHLLANPSRQEFNQQLWDERGWDLLFFAGHSQTEGVTGRIYLNEDPQHNSLTVEQFESAIKEAVSRGLKLAIFNSCDGFGLATALSNLHIPQVIVMREPIANRVAQEFFRYFLIAFAQQQQSLYLAMRQARQQLQGLEHEFPGASWLPVLWQNPAVEPITWQDWCRKRETRHPFGFYRSLQTVLLTSVIVTTVVLGVRYLGKLQRWELKAFDQLLQLRSPEPPDGRILIITITEEDLHLPEQAQRKGSLSDVALTKLLQILTPLKPRAIGLDVYRDSPMRQQSVQLAAELSRQRDFFAICKVDDPAGDFPEIAPMPNLPSDRHGFSDVVIDVDHVLRRQLLFMDQIPAASCWAPYALSTQLAFHYLKAEGIAPQYTTQGNLQLGNYIFERLHYRSGSYQQADTAGYQILLNYRFVDASLSPAPIVTLKDVLAGRLKLEDVRDRIVLIGVTAPSSKDFLPTPYGQRIPGVLLQAQMVSQLISAVKDGREPIMVWSWQSEIIWIWGWAVMGGIFAWRCRSIRKLLLLDMMAIGTLSVLCFYGLSRNQWVPFVPTAFGFLITNVGVAFIVAKEGYNYTKTQKGQ